MYDKYTKVVEAEFPRLMMHAAIPMGAPLAVVFDHYRLQRNRVSEFRKHVNLFFLAGTGMTKAVWQYHIKRLFAYSETHPELPWQIVNCVAMDLVNHGDSAVENDGILGWEFDWREGSHDLIQVVKSLRLTGDNVVVGHSMGGFQAMYSTLISPIMFKFAVCIEPVTHATDLEGKAFLYKVLPAVSQVLFTEFKNEKQYEDFMRHKSFYKKANAEILNDFIKSEKITLQDGSIRMKTSKEMQMICYHAGTRIFSKGLDFFRAVECPLVLISGGKASWNPKNNVVELEKCNKRIEVIKVKEGEHLLSIERPDETVDLILKSLSKHIEKKQEAEPAINRNRYNEIFQEKFKALEQSFMPSRGKL